MIIHAHTVSPTSVSSVLLRPWFIVLVLAGAVERLCGVATGVAVERDWVILVLSFCAVIIARFFNGYCFNLLETLAISNAVSLCVQLAGMNRPIALAQANAVLNRIDLICEVCMDLYKYDNSIVSQYICHELHVPVNQFTSIVTSDI
jgi:hypothetical protein